MERRNYLLALALPALLAACTQDELMTENANNDGLKLVENPIENFNLKVNVAEDVQTRVTTGAEWQVGDQMGLVWFNAYYYDWNDQMQQLNKPQFYANNRMTISKDGSGTGVWTSDAVIMEGQHFAYFPFQTVWGEDYLQVKGGQEILKVYNTAAQEDDVNNRLSWMMNHQTLLSPSYEFTDANGGAGISDERRIDLYLFSNRLNIKPKFINAPADLKVYSYELETYNVNNKDATYDAFVTEAEILANKLPESTNFGGCNWATIDNANIKLGDFYNPTKFTSSLEVTYAQKEGIDAATAPKFAFLLLPADVEDLTWAKYWDGNSVIWLTAHTNYGDITISDVTGKFSANMTTESTISLSKLYYNAENVSIKQAADTYVGFLGNAGTTRGAETGDNGNITATFDFKDIDFTLECVKNNATLNRVLRMIANYKKILGDDYKEATITLCENVTFKDLALTELLEQKEEEIGVDINITGKTWQEDGATKYSKITWTGESSIAQEIPNTNNYVEGTLTAEVNTKDGLTTTYVLDGGTLNNLGTARAVTVEKGGLLNNNYGLVKTANNYGTIYNNPATTDKLEDQPTIGKLYNYATTYNYANIESVEANENDDETAVIILKDNENLAANGTYQLGAIFSIGEVYEPETNIQYTVDDESAVLAGSCLATALNNYATDIYVEDGVNINATAAGTMNGNEYGARVTFLGKTTYTISSSAQFDNAVRLGEIVLAENAKVTVENELWNSGRLTIDVYALAASRTALNDGSKLTIGGGAIVATREVYVEPNAEATISTEKNVENSKLYFIYETTLDATLTKSGNVNYMPEDIKAKFGWD